MKFKVKKEELNRFFKSINMFAHVTEDVVLEGKSVGESKKKCKGALKRNPDCSGCNKPQPKPIEEIEKLIFNKFEDEELIAIIPNFNLLKNKLNELIKDRNEKPKQ